ncbi:response regulator [Paenibacillus sp. N3.4]|uniref:response regulator transcription factor n=1 Tax=Paenibacillus sp. N3.4 TaxID=2603222 RepID=UPI0011C7EA50|nr:response regulator [Paenibacillus sp. N3.4]TXK74157.1 response regulator [Paenibacillus sp. N3.4]
MYKLLVIDDEQATRNNICTVFPWEELGFRIVASAENGKQGLDFLSSHEADVLLCDIRMPVMSGIDLAAELYQQKRKIKIVFLSGYRDFEYAKKALDYEVKNYIVKPARYTELTQVFTKIKHELDQEQAALETIRDHAEDKSKVAQGININDKIIKSVKQFVQENYKEATLEAAAYLVHMHPNYLSQLFNNKTGQYFSNYLIEVKMEKAAELLNDIQLRTFQVSEMVGYSNAKNFTRTFKKYFGKNPREFRNSEATDDLD